MPGETCVHAQPLLLLVDWATVDGVAALAAVLEAAPTLWVAVEVLVAAVTLALLATMYPVISSMLPTPAAPTARRAVRAGCGRFRRIEGCELLVVLRFMSSSCRAEWGLLDTNLHVEGERSV